MLRAWFVSALGLLSVVSPSLIVACSSKSDGAPFQAAAGSSAAGAAGAAQAQTGGASGAVSSGGAGVGGASSAGAAGVNAGGAGGAGGAAMAGAGASAGASAGGALGSCSAQGLVLCDDFEMQPLGAQPMGAPWAASNCFDTTHVLKVDSAEAHSGTRSLVSQNIPYADCQLHADLGTLSEFYARAWVYFAPGNADQFEAHEVSVFELVPAASTDDPSIRVGFRGNTCLPEGIELNITGGMEQTGCTGKTPVAGAWSCY
ncbi:MAG TPA: hypothetical protein VF294_02075 [Polyangiaceae bacterium]